VTRLREDWETVLGYLADQDAIVVLDEFPYLVEQDESLPSVLQAMFDHEFDDSSATFVLVGSSISMMEEAALLGNSPLYGRSSLKMDIRQLPFDAAMQFFDEDVPADDQGLHVGCFRRSTVLFRRGRSGRIARGQRTANDTLPPRITPRRTGLRV